MDAGRILMQGLPVDVLDYYHAMLAERDHHAIRQVPLDDGRVATISGTGEAYVADVRLVDENDRPVGHVEVGQTVRLRVIVRTREAIPRLVLGFMITDRLGHCIYGINTHRLDQPLENLQAGEEASYCFSFPTRLGKGSYSVSLALSRGDSHIDKNYEWRDNALLFHVINTRHENFVGCSWLDASVEITRGASTEPGTSSAGCP
jgi:lipopolysaccharide transport system ATP-binding protein